MKMERIKSTCSWGHLVVSEHPCLAVSKISHNFFPALLEKPNLSFRLRLRQFRCDRTFSNVLAVGHALICCRTTLNVQDWMVGTPKSFLAENTVVNEVIFDIVAFKDP